MFKELNESIVQFVSRKNFRQLQKEIKYKIT